MSKFYSIDQIGVVKLVNTLKEIRKLTRSTTNATSNIKSLWAIKRIIDEILAKIEDEKQ